MFNLKWSFFDTASSLYQGVVIFVYGCVDIYRIIFYIVGLFLSNESDDFEDLIPELEVLIPELVNAGRAVGYGTIYSLFMLYYLVNHIWLLPLCFILELQNLFSYLCCLLYLTLSFFLSGIFDWDFLLNTSNWRTELYPSPDTIADYRKLEKLDLGESDYSSSGVPSSDSGMGITGLQLFKIIVFVTFLLFGTFGMSKGLIGIIVYKFFNEYTAHEFEAGSNYRFYRFLVYWFASINVYSIIWLFSGF